MVECTSSEVHEMDHDQYPIHYFYSYSEMQPNVEIKDQIPRRPAVLTSNAIPHNIMTEHNIVGTIGVNINGSHVR